jgi:hypothetical protein
MREIRKSMFRTSGKAKLLVFDKVKWECTKEDTYKEIQYNELTHWVIITGEDATELESTIDDENYIDKFHEYLELNFKDGSTATYRNSNVDLFVL